MNTRPYADPPALRAAALDGYARAYGAPVLELDRALSAAPAPDDLIDLTHGDTRAFPPPASATVDLSDAVRENDEAYTPYRGSLSLRERLAPRLATLLGRPIDAERELIVTPGTQGGLFAALSALVGPRDAVALPDPDYFMSERIVAYLGGHAVRLPLDVAGDGRLSVRGEALAPAESSRLLLLSHPNNPTGGVYGPSDVRTLADWVIEGDRVAVVDQLYCRQTFAGAEFTHLAALPGMSERTITLLGPSKTESMSGFRVGVAVGPDRLIDAMERVLAMASLRTGAYAQQAMRHWMDRDEDWLAQRIAAHQALRDELVSRLRAIPGVTVASPLGSSYVFPESSTTDWEGRPGNALAIELKATGVLINPGYQFGMGHPARFRINFSQDAARLALAADRIAGVLGR